MVRSNVAACLLTLVIALSAVEDARADSLSGAFNGIDRGQSRVVNVTLRDRPALNNSYYAGSLMHTIGGTSAVGLFCIEFDQAVEFGGHDYAVLDIADAGDGSTNFGAERTDRVHAIVGAALGLGWMERGSMLVGSGDLNIDRDRGAAIQLLLWESLEEDAGSAWDLGSGAFVANLGLLDGVSDRVAELMDYINERELLGQRVAGLAALASDTSQDQLVVVPLPRGAFIGLACMSAIGFAHARRRMLLLRA